MTICVLGRQPELGLAELESLYGSECVHPAGGHCALVEANIDFARLGGSVKAAELVASIPNTSRKAVFKKVAELLPTILKTFPSDGKIKLGLSVYDFGITPYELNGEALRLKKIIRSSGRSVRVVPNEAPALSSAQTYHNRLAGELGIEFIIVHDGDTTHIGRVTHVQDIDSYRIRDRERPKRDAFVGMLPPKLAQIIVNLAIGQWNIEDSESQKSLLATSQLPIATILDPFCGTGVILQEALLMGYTVYGTDLSEKMIDYSTANMNWLLEGRKMKEEGRIKLEKADATKHGWDFSFFNLQPSTFSIATETYLGQPLGGQTPTKEKFAEIVHETNTVVKGFFQNIAPQLAPETRLCVAVPVWFHDDTTHLPVIDELTSMGFVRHSFTHVAASLMYHRENQVTGRELLVLTKI